MNDRPRLNKTEVIRRATRFPAGWCPVCRYWLAEVASRRFPGKPFLCVECRGRFDAREAVGDPETGVSLRDWDAAVWAKQQDATAMAGMEVDFGAVVAGVLARADRYRSEVASVRGELAELGVAIAVTGRGPVLRGNVAAVTPELLGRVKDVREGLAAET